MQVFVFLETGGTIFAYKKDYDSGFICMSGRFSMASRQNLHINPALKVVLYAGTVCFR